MSEETPKEPGPRRTILIGDGADDLPDIGLPIDPLLAGETEASPGPAAKAKAGTAKIGSTEVDEARVTERIGEDGQAVTTITIGDDELPDATYTAHASRSPDEPDHNRPRVDPRMKARRLAVRRAAGRRRFWWVIVGIVVLVLGLAALAVFSSSLFAVKEVQVTGAANSDPSQIAEITDDLMGKPILTADFHAIEKRLEALPWVRYARVTMDFPHTVHVQLAERVPVAAFQTQSDGRWRIIDVDGRVIAVLCCRPIDYVSIFGPGLDRIEGETATPAYAKVAQFITALPPVLRPVVQYFTIDAQESVFMTLKLSTAPAGTADADQETTVDLCPAAKLDTKQLVALTAFIETKVDRAKTPPARITACTEGLITTSSP